MSDAAKFTPYSAEYLSLLARKRKLPAKKIGKTWFTTKTALNDYMQRQMIRTNVQNGMLHDDYKKIENPAAESAELNYIRERLSQGIVGKISEEKKLDSSGSQELFIGEMKKISESISGSMGNLSKNIEQIISLQKEEAVKKSTEEDVTTKEDTTSKEIKTEEEYAETVFGKFIAKFINFLDLSTEEHFGIFHRIWRFIKNSYKAIVSRPTTFFLFLIIVIFLMIAPVRFIFGFVDDAFSYAVNKIKDAQTVLGFRPGTHQNEILLLDKNGNVSISGNIETEGQFQSFIKDGIAPITVESTTKVDNLNADYLDNLHAEEFTLAYVTKNGNITSEDVFLDGKVEVGKTLLVKGATKLLSAVEVDGQLGVFGNANFKKSITVDGPAYFNGLLNAKDIAVSGFVTGNIISGQLVNAQSIVANQTLSSDGNFRVKGQSNFGGFAFFSAGLQARTGDFELALGVGGDFSATGNVGLGRVNKDVNIKSQNWNINSAGAGSFTYLSAASSTIGDLYLSKASTTRLSVSDYFWSNGTTDIGNESSDILNINAGNWVLASSTATTTVAMTSGLNFDSGTFVIDPYLNFIGIGTAVPAYNLDVSGGIGIVAQFSGRVIGADAANNNEFATLGQVSAGGGPWSRTAPYVYLTTISDNVGIGTSSPFAKLSVAGSGFFNDNLTASNITATGTLSVTGQTTLGFASTTAISGTNANFTNFYGALTGTASGNLTASTTNLDISNYLISNNASSTITNLHTINASSTSLATSNFYLNTDGQLTSFVGKGLSIAGNTLTVNATTSLNQLVTVGTIGTGAWQGTPVGTEYGGTGLSTGGLKATFIPFGNGTNAFATSTDLSFTLATRIFATTFASTTAFSTSYASSTLYYGAMLQTCNATTGKLTWANGQFSCGTDAGGGTADPFSFLTTYGNLTAATSSNLWLKSALYASSTSIFDGLLTFGYASGTQLTTTGSTYLATSGGNVGIGTTSPWKKFSVSGDMSLTGAFYDSAAKAGSSGWILQSTGSATEWVATSTLFTPGAQVLPVGTQGQTLSVQDSVWQATSTLYISSDRKVGIMTSAPGGTLHVAGVTTADTPQGDIVMSRLWTSSSDTRASSLFHYYDSGISTDQLVFGVSGEGGTSLIAPNQLSQAKMVIEATGKVGIGTTEPWDRLTVYGGDISVTGGDIRLGTGSATTTLTVSSSAFAIAANATTTLGTTGLAVGTNQFVVQQTSGNVGIGTTAPAEKLEVEATAADSYIRIDSSDFGRKSGFKLRQSTNYGFDVYQSDSASQGLYFDSVVNGANTTNLFIQRQDVGGNVGIATTSPFAKLSVAGNGFFNGNLTAANITATGTLVALDSISTPYFVATDDSVTSTIAGGLAVQIDKFVVLQSDGYVGVGTDTPWGLLSVNPNGISGPSFVVGSSTATKFIVTNAGNIGMGTSNPDAYGTQVVITNASNVGSVSLGSYLLMYQNSGTPYNNYISAIQGDSNLTFEAIQGSQPSSFTFQARAGGGATGASGSQNFVNIIPTIRQGGTADYTAVLINPTEITIGSGNNYLQRWQLGGADKAVITTSGLVGIGTTSPFAKLSVAGSGFFNDNLTASNITATGTLSAITICLTGDICRTTWPTGGGGLGSIGGTWATTTSTVLNQLINSPLNNSDIVAIGDNSTTSAEYWFDPNAGVSYLSGSVGIGTSNIAQIGGYPYKLDIYDNYNGAAYLALFQNNNPGGSAASIFQIAADSVSSNMSIFSLSSGYVGTYGGETAAGLQGLMANHGRIWFGTADNYDFYLGTNFTTRMTIKNTGNIGIGTSTPFATLSVAGSGFFNDSLTASNITATGTMTVTGLVNCDTIDTDANGLMTCGTDATGAGGGTSDFSFLTTYGVKAAATSSNLWLKGGLYASSTSIFDGLLTFGHATGTQLTTTGSTYLATTEGNVGIGTASLTSALTMGASKNIYMNNGTVRFNDLTGYLMRIADSSDVTLYDIGAYWDSTPEVKAFSIRDSYGPINLVPGNGGALSGSYLTVIDGGNVGISTTTPQWPLTVYSVTVPQLALDAGAGIDQWTLRNVNTNLYFATSSNSTYATNTIPAMTILSSGNVGIGTAAPGAVLEVKQPSGFSGEYTTIFVNGDDVYGNNDVRIGAIGGAAGIWFGNPSSVTRFRGSDGVMEFASQYDINSYISFRASNSLQFQDSNGSEKMRFDTINGFVGIGTTSPYSLLSISNNLNTTANTPLLTIASTTAGTATSTFLTVLANGNVGIGTAAPISKLDVYAGLINISNGYGMMWEGNQSLSIKNSSNILTLSTYDDIEFKTYDTGSSAYTPRMTIDGATGKVGIGNADPYSLLHLQSANANNTPIADIILARYWNGSADTRASSIFHYYDSALATDELVFAVSGGGGTSDAPNQLSQAKMVVQANGNVGIGTTTPFAKLSVAGSGFFNGNITASNITATGTMSLTGALYDSTASAGTSGWILKTTGSATEWVSTSTLFVSGGTGGTLPSGAQGQTLTFQDIAWQATSTLYVSSAKKVGIGSTTPWATLSVNAAAGANSFAIGSSTATYFLVNSSGNIGIGTTSPFAKLSVAGSGFFNDNLTASNITATGTLAVQSTTATSTFSTGGLTVGTSQFVVQQTSGNIGIGTTSPFAKLSVAGSGFFNGNITASNITATGTMSLTGALYDSTASAGTSGWILKTTGSATEWVSTSTLFVSGGTGGTLPSGAQGQTLTFQDIAWQATSTLYVSSAKKVGIGSTTPWATLSVNAAAGANSFAIGSSTATYFLVNSSGNIGIGTTSPSAKLGIADNNTSNLRGLRISNTAASVPTYFDIAGGYPANYDQAITLSVNDIVYMDFNAAIQSMFFHKTVYVSDNVGMVASSNGGNGFIPWNTGDGNSFTIGSVNEIHFNTGTLGLDQRLTIENNGNVGIGTTTPKWILNPYSSTAPQLALSDGAGIGQWVFRNAGGNLYFATTTTTGTTATTSTSALTIIGSSGNVGIGTSSPSQQLSVAGTIYTTGGIRFSDGTTQTTADRAVRLSAVRVYTSGTNVSYTSPTAAGSYIVVEVWGGGAGGGAGSINGNGGGGGGYSQEFIAPTLATTYYYTVGGSGTGGVIGGDTDGTAGETTCFGTSATACSSPNLQATGGAVSAIAGGGAGGVGTLGDINLYGGNGDANKVSAETSPTSYYAGGAGGSSPKGGAGGVGKQQAAGTAGVNPGGGGGGGGYYNGTGYNGGAGGAGQVVVYEYTTVTAGTDLAESYPTADPTISAGDIVSFDGTNPINIKRAQKGDNRPLAGIISTKPGLLLGEGEFPGGAAGERPVALSGRVPARVSLENGPIAIGDRIALSSVAGVGKKAESYEASVGIAIAPFIGGSDGAYEGTVIVFMDLQMGNSLLSRLTVNNAGNIGIGTTTPLGLFSIDSSGTIGPTFVISSSTVVNFIVTESGNVGIGVSATSTLTHKLEVAGDIAATGFINVSTRDAKKDISFLTNGNYDEVLKKINDTKVATYYYAGESADTISVRHPMSNTYLGENSITEGKRLGLIAEEAPVEILSANGKGVDLYKMTSFVFAGIKALSGKLDNMFSENYKSIEGLLEEGDLVMADENSANHIRKTNKSYENSVLGVISGAPDAEDPLLNSVAFSGKHIVKVSLEGGEIKVGDKLTSSSVSGVAMKATTSAQIIGIALQGYNGTAEGSVVYDTVTVGKINVFINLGYAKLNPQISGGTVNVTGTGESSFWDVDESSGRIKFIGALDINDFDMVNVKAISGSRGMWSIDENGKLLAKEVETGKLNVKDSVTIGTKEKPIGMTIFEKGTGNPICVYAEGGVLKTVSGECGAEAVGGSSAGGVNALELPQNPSDTSASTTVSGPPEQPEQATSTPEAVIPPPETLPEIPPATSTPPAETPTP